MRTTLQTILLLVVTTMIGFDGILAQDNKPGNIPPWEKVQPWKHARPNPDAIIQPGSQVYLFTNIKSDPFNGLYNVDVDGMVLPRFCERPVKIGGFSEVEASAIVHKHTVASGVYKGAAVRVYAFKAK